ncbi:hypothetical protein ACIHCQ_42350 [Streptomyces sp. NPDC052236]
MTRTALFHVQPGRGDVALLLEPPHVLPPGIAATACPVAQLRLPSVGECR